jgi:hypothetical protein
MFTTATAIHDYALAGHAILTLTSAKTGKHFTYKVSQAKDDAGEPKNFWFVGLLTGPDNYADYSYIGTINRDLAFSVGAKSKVPADAPSARGFAFFWKFIVADELPKDMTVQHEGSCGRCGRKLTDPVSIETGLGPICRGL